MLGDGEVIMERDSLFEKYFDLVEAGFIAIKFIFISIIGFVLCVVLLPLAILGFIFKLIVPNLKRLVE